MKRFLVFMKRTIMCFSMLMVVNTALAQNFQTTHEVQRGETLSSIAKQYGVTEQMIKDANPQAGNLFYVGLKLNIPQKTQNIEEKQHIVNEQNDNISVETHSNQTGNENKKKSSSYKAAYNEAIRNSSKANYNESLENTSTEKDEHVEANDYSFNLDFDDPFTIGFGASFDDTKYSFLYWGLGLSSYEGEKKNTYDNMTFGNCIFGYGAKQRFVYDAFLFQIKAFPYIGLSMTDYYEGKESKSDYDFTYGAAGNVSVGLKAWTTSKGNDAFITLGYYIEAPKFKTEKMMKNGSWLFGLTIVLNN